MPFKIIKTIEKGKERLAIIPSGWENNGILRWPGKNVTLKLLIKNANSKPLPDWKKMECVVKRSSVTTYEKAEEELDMMLDCSDTDRSGYQDRKEKATLQKSVDYNAIAASLQHAEESIVIPIGQQETACHQEDSAVISGESSVFQIIPDSDNSQASNINKVLENQKQILDNQENITQNQNIIHEMQKQVFEKQEKTTRQLANLTVLVEDSFKKIIGNQKPVVKLGEAKPYESEDFMIKPISDANELNKLENCLADKTENKKMQLQFGLLFKKSDGSGISCAYKMLDLKFTREFLCQCSWSGGSKGQIVKIALKAYRNILNFFFTLIHSWDSTYTNDLNENFFKTVLKNAGKRVHIKNLRASTKRRRKQSGTSNKRSKKAPAMETEKETIEVSETIQDGNEEASNEKASENNQEPENDIAPNENVQENVNCENENVEENESLC